MNLKFVVVGLLAIAVSSLSVWAEEDGTKDNPYLIGTEADLAKVTAHGMGAAGKGVYFELTADIALAAKWPGFGTYAKTDPTDYFSGIFDGKGHKISNVVFSNASANNYRGFFNQIVGGTVRNLTVATTGFGTVDLPTGEYGCAAIAGAAYDATLECCAAEGTISGTHNVGGIVVRIRDASLVACTNRATVTGSYTKVAGVCVLDEGSATGLIEGCVNEGTVTAAGSAKAGQDGVAGVIAYVHDAALTIKDCENKGTVAKGATSSATAKIGQIVGYIYTNSGVPTFEGTIKGTTAVRMVGDVNGKAIGRHLATVSGSVATFVPDADIASGTSYKALATGTVTLADFCGGIRIDSSLAAVTVATSVANAKLVKVGDRYSVMSDGVIDITKAVREAGKGTTTLDVGDACGKCYTGYNIDNAFSNSNAKADRIMLTKKYNRINWMVADDYAAGQPIVVTKYTMKRTFPPDTGSPYDVNRAPTEFYLQGTLDQGTPDKSRWITLNHQRGLVWSKDELVKTFEIDPVVCGAYRRYRLVTAETNAAKDDVVPCSFMYVNLFGTIGDYEPLSRAAKRVDHIRLGSGRTALTDFVPTLDSKVELDYACGSNVAGNQCIFAANYSSGCQNHFRLFIIDGKWVWFYGSGRVDSTVSAYPYGRYKIVIDGPVVTVNGVEVIGAGGKTKLTGSADLQMLLFASFGSPSEGLKKRNNTVAEDGRLYSCKVTDPNGQVTFNLEPVQTRDGVGALRDTVSGRLYVADQIANRLVKNFLFHDKELDVTDSVRTTAGCTPTITMVEGTSHDTYSVTNLFTRKENGEGRALFLNEANVIQYVIPETYKPGDPIVLSRFALLPCVGNSGYNQQEVDPFRAPSLFKLEGSADGETWVTLYSTDGTGWGPGRFCEGELAETAGGYKGHLGVMVNIPEENRGDYRRYRFSTFKSSYTGEWKMGLQELRFYGYVGGLEPRHEPLEYVESPSSGNMYFKTGVVPKACDLTVEIEGEFMNTNHTGCLFCSRESSSKFTNSWTLFLLNGGFRFDCGEQGTVTAFKPEANRNYKIVAKKNKLYVDDNLVATTGDGNFVPYSELSLFMSHNNLAGWGNKAMFRLRHCRILDGTGAVLRDYFPAKQTNNGKIALFDRVTGWMRDILKADNELAAPVEGPLTDIDFWQRDREVSLVTELEEECLPRTPLTFAFSGNQRFGAKLYAAFDNAYRGTDTNAWAKVVELGDVKTGVDTLTTETKLANPEHYSHVKFFVCDTMERGVSQTRTYKTPVSGTMILIR